MTLYIWLGRFWNLPLSNFMAIVPANVNTLSLNLGNKTFNLGVQADSNSYKIEEKDSKTKVITGPDGTRFLATVNEKGQLVTKIIDRTSNPNDFSARVWGKEPGGPNGDSVVIREGRLLRFIQDLIKFSPTIFNNTAEWIKQQGTSFVNNNFNGSNNENISWSNLPLATSGFKAANRGKGDIKRIVLHETLGETTEAAIRTLKQRGLSYHTIVDGDGTATKYVDPKDIAWGAKGVNEDAISIAAAHTESECDIKVSQQHTFEKLIRKYIKDYYNGEPIEISYHGQHGGTDCNVFGTHEAYENWVKTKLGDLLKEGKIRLYDSSITVNQPNQPGTRVA